MDMSAPLTSENEWCAKLIGDKPQWTLRPKRVRNAWCQELIQRELKAHALKNNAMTIKIISGLIRKVLDHEHEQHTKLCEDMRKEFSDELASLRKDIGVANGTVRELPAFLKREA